MNDVAKLAPSIPAITDDALEWVRAVEHQNAALPQVPIVTHHLIHGGMYCRTIKLPMGVCLTGALIERATTLIVSGAVVLNTGEVLTRLVGYHVIPASARRKQVFVALSDTDMTMIYVTNARTVQEAEEELTGEADLLFSRSGENIVTITGD